MTRSSDNRCAHCRAPLAADAPHTSDAFCCSGCSAAHALLVDAGLHRYYDLGLTPGAPGELTPQAATWLPALLDEARARATSPDRVVLELDVQGLRCAACVWLFQELFKRAGGGHHLAVNPGLGRLRLTFDPATFPLERWLADLTRVGYRMGPPSRSGRVPSDDLGLRLGVTFAIAMNAMALSFATYLGLQPNDDAGLYTLFGWVELALSTLALAVAGPVFFRGAWLALRSRMLHLDVPIALGVAGAWVGSVVLFFSGHREQAYFDTLDIFLVLMLLGRWAQRRLLDSNRRLLLEDDGFEHARVKVVDARGHIEHRPLSALAANVRFLVAPGELVPVAADLAADPAGDSNGSADFDLAWITGESEPTRFTSDARPVPAGAHLVGRQAQLMVAREAFSASALHDLLIANKRADETGPAQDDPFWHRLTVAWVITVLAFAALTALVWWSVAPATALQYATAVLVVTCPCAIGLATPLAYELALLRLRRKGLLARRPGLLDRARRIRHVVFDKTGTLTWSELAVVAPDALRALPDAALHMLWQLTARSNHPKSRAIQRELPTFTLASETVVETPGLGLACGDYRLEGDGTSLVFRDAEHEFVRLTFRETLRPEARAEVDRLRATGVRVHIASGDTADKVMAIAGALGIPPEDAHAALDPEGKAALVTALGADCTLVLGDGVNDARAFEVALVAGTPAIDRPTLPARADFVLLGQGIGPIAELITLARTTRRVTVRNLVIASAYNALGLTAGVLGWLSPVVAAVAMPASSLIVIGLTLAAYRARRASPQASHQELVWTPST